MKTIDFLLVPASRTAIDNPIIFNRFISIQYRQYLPILEAAGKIRYAIGMENTAPLYMISFKIEEDLYAIHGSHLIGVACNCPFVTYPGLPKEICGIIEWNGKIFPVLKFVYESIRLSQIRHSNFILFKKEFSNYVTDFALFIPNGVSLFKVESINTEKKLAFDKSGKIAKIYAA